ncbi:MAG: deoxyribodipyrimidine photolyase [Verrucomicrobia bacterium]|nr:deoxyribodipyrimidine photolyase [Verrucomicrobiota bacterium]
MKTIDPRRVFRLKEGSEGGGVVVYWMSRDQRIEDNWALLLAQQEAILRRRPLHVVFTLAPAFGHANLRHYAFMFHGLHQVEKGLAAKGIPFVLLKGDPHEMISVYARNIDAALLVVDFDPLRKKREWIDRVLKRVNIPVLEVDAHNIVPCRLVSQKVEYGAYTLRPKLNRLLPEFLVEIPSLKKHPFSADRHILAADWQEAMKWLSPDRSVGEVTSVKPGAAAARRRLEDFVERALADYDLGSRDPCMDGTSRLSPYLHFGQISAHRVALEVEKVSAAGKLAKGAFLEQLVVRRELSDNFCFYNKLYDSPDGFPEWARATLARHGKDKRQYAYGLEELEQGKTHDPLWNAAQLKLVRDGWMHGYLRMYWAKKILEWTAAPGEPLERANYLNDRYQLDGRDPNGYVGTAWSIGGVHDRAWSERPIFGKIRYMSYKGCRSKFDVEEYVGVTP